jgi:uncharacterized protein YggT (Ycf19 family)
MVLASVRGDVVGFLATLIYIYILVIFMHVVLQMLFSVGVRVPYSRWSDALIGFLRDLSEPLLRAIRGVMPSLGAFDLSPMVAIVILWIIRNVLLQIIGT